MRPVVHCLLLTAFVAGPTEARPLTEEEFLTNLSPDHPALATLERELGEALAEERAASVVANPDFSLEREAWGEVPQQTTMTLNWAPPLLGGRGPRRDAARAGVDQARSRVDDLRFQMRSRARASYATWWAATEEVNVLTRQSALVGTVVERVRNRTTTGEESGLTARRFELAHLRLRADVARAEVGLFRALADIQAWFGTWNSEWEPVRPLLPGLPDSLRWEAKPEIQALRASVQKAEHGRRAAGQFLRSPSLEFGWMWQDGDAAGIDGPWAGLVWNVPIFDRNQSAKTRAASELRSSRAELETGIRRARAGITAATNSYEKVQNAARDAWASIEDTESLFEAAGASFQAGESTDTDLLEMLRSILEARLSAIQLYSEALEAHRALEEAGGSHLTAGGSR